MEIDVETKQKLDESDPGKSGTDPVGNGSGSVTTKVVTLDGDVPPYIRFYSDQLKFLWEQYIKLIQLGLLASSVTVGFSLQYIIANESVRKLLRDSCSVGSRMASKTLNFTCETGILLGMAISLATIAAICFIISRWCSQILMERQVYADEEKAKAYFVLTKSIFPTAITPKPYTSKLFNLKDDKGKNQVVVAAGRVNEVFKFLGIISMLVSWLLLILSGVPLLKSI